MAVIVFTNWMERETVREKVNDSTTRRNFRMKRNKRQRNFIESIIHVD